MIDPERVLKSHVQIYKEYHLAHLDEEPGWEEKDYLKGRALHYLAEVLGSSSSISIALCPPGISSEAWEAAQEVWSLQESQFDAKRCPLVKGKIGLTIVGKGLWSFHKKIGTNNFKIDGLWIDKNHYSLWTKIQSGDGSAEELARFFDKQKNT